MAVIFLYGRTAKIKRKMLKKKEKSMHRIALKTIYTLHRIFWQQSFIAMFTIDRYLSAVMVIYSYVTPALVQLKY